MKSGNLNFLEPSGPLLYRYPLLCILKTLVNLTHSTVKKSDICTQRLCVMPWWCYQKVGLNKEGINKKYFH